MDQIAKDIANQPAIRVGPLSSYDLRTRIEGYISSRAFSQGLYGGRQINVTDVHPGSEVIVKFDVGFLGIAFAADGPNACEVKVEYVVSIGDRFHAVYGEVQTEDGLEKGFFNVDLIVALKTPSTKKFIAKCVSQVKRDEYKRETRFDPAFFTPGTRVMVEAVASDDVVKEITVRCITKQGPDNYCINTGVKVKVADYEMEEGYSTSYVTSIVEQSRKKLVVEPQHEYQMKDLTFADRFQLEHHVGKSNNYFVHDVSGLVFVMAAQFLRYDQTIDVHRLTNMLEDRGFFKYVLYADFALRRYHGYVKVINKKKLKRAMRQLINKALVNPAEQQLIDDQHYDEHHY